MADSGDGVASLFHVLRGRLKAQMESPSTDEMAVNAPWVVEPSPDTLDPRKMDVRDVMGAPAVLLATAMHAMPSRALQHFQWHYNGYASQRRDPSVARQRAVRKHRVRRLQEMHTVVDAVCDEQRWCVEQEQQRFLDHVAATTRQAQLRLQALFLECAAEMQKAIERVARASVDDESDQVDASHMDMRQRRLQYDLFLARLHEDTDGAMQGSVLYPPLRDAHDLTFSSMNRPQEAEGAWLVELEHLLAANGPVLHAKESIEIRSVVALSSSTPRKSEIRANRMNGRSSQVPSPSLHFAESAENLWVELIRASQPQEETTRVPVRNSTSAMRRQRRLPSSSRRLSPTYYSSKCDDGTYSNLRRLRRSEVTQFADVAGDTMLSAGHVRWLLPRSGITQSRVFQLKDTSIYLNLSECDAFLNQPDDSGENHADEGTGTNTFAECVKREKQRLRNLRERATGFATDSPSIDLEEWVRGVCIGAVVNDQGTQLDNSTTGGVFVRASLLQLLQTAYFATEFTEALAPADKLLLETRYPPSAWRGVPLQNLYVGAAYEAGQVTPMHALDSGALHELCLVYVMRGRRGQDDNDHPLYSLARSSAISTLLPDVSPAGDDHFVVQRRHCEIKNPQFIFNEAVVEKEPDLAAVALSATALIIEYDVVKQSEIHSSEQQRLRTATATSKSQFAKALLGEMCHWRSCLDNAGDTTNPVPSGLCLWHSQMQNYLTSEIAAHYITNSREMEACYRPRELQYAADTVRRMIIKSSSLLEEVTTKHLVHSIDAFFAHTTSLISNAAYERERRGQSEQWTRHDPEDLDSTDGDRRTDN